MYEVLISPAAKDQFRKLDRQIQERISVAFQRLQIRPEDHLIKLVEKPGYKMRIGDYRAIVDIDRANNVVLIMKVGHRKTIYRNI